MAAFELLVGSFAPLPHANLPLGGLLTTAKEASAAFEPQCLKDGVYSLEFHRLRKAGLYHVITNLNTLHDIFQDQK